MNCRWVNPILFLFLGLSLAGCELYQEGYSLQSDVSECEASGADCSTATGANLLGLHISNPQPYTIPRANVRHFDISGLCNEGDFPENVLEWSVHHVDSGLAIHTNQRIFQACKRGKFRFQVSIDGAHTPTNAPEYNQIHRVTVELIGRDINGTEHRNTLAARRYLDLLAINP